MNELHLQASSETITHVGRKEARATQHNQSFRLVHTVHVPRFQGHLRPAWSQTTVITTEPTLY